MRPGCRARRCPRRAQRRVARGGRHASAAWPPASTSADSASTSAATGCTRRREPRVRALLDELLGADLQVRRRNGRLHLAGRWVAFPLQARRPRAVRPCRRRAPASPPTSSPARWRRPRDGSYAEFVRAGLGPTALATFHGPMATKLWGCDPSGLSAELAATADRRQRRRPSAPAHRPWRQAGGTHLPLPAARLRRGRRPPRRSRRRGRRRRSRLAGVVGRARRRVGRCASRSTTGARIDAGSRAVDRSAGRARRRGRRCPGRCTTRPPRSRARLPRRSTRTATATSTPTTCPDPDVAFARLSEPKNYRDGPGPGRPHRALRRGAGDRRRRVLDGERRRSWRTSCSTAWTGSACAGRRSAGVEVRRLPRVYPVIAVDDDARRRARWRGPTASTASPCSGARACRRRQPPSRHGHGARRGRMPRSATAGTRRGGRAERARFDAFVVDD